TLIYMVSALPFFFTGLLFSVVFARENHRISQLYGADLLGGAVACMAIVPVLNFIGGPNAIVLAAATMAAAAAIWSEAKNRRFAVAIAAGLLAILVANTALHGR